MPIGLLAFAVMLVVVLAVGIALEVWIRRERRAGRDPISPAMRRWGARRRLWSAGAAALLGVALVSPLGLDFGRFAWVAGIVLLAVALALVLEGLRALRRG